MKKLISGLSLLSALLALHPVYAQTTTYQVRPQDIHSGYIVEKIVLNDNAVPKVLLSDITYTTDVALPRGAKPSDPHNFQVQVGVDRKVPFAVVRIPAFVAGNGQGHTNQVSSFKLTVNEAPATERRETAAKSTDVQNSVLAQGKWYKIAVTKTGFYTIDYNFIKSMGLSPANVNPGDIRIFGNGGNMLSENNAVPRAVDLIENAIQVNDNGDNVFDANESVVFYATGPLAWFKDSVDGRFLHQNNLYSDTAYYFITVDQGPGLRIAGQGAVPAANKVVTDFNYHAVHDSDMVNPAGLGKSWYGESFHPQAGTTSQTFNFNFGSSPVASLYCTVQFASTANIAGNIYSVSLNGTPIGDGTFTSGTSGDDVMSLMTTSWPVTLNSPTAAFNINFTSSPDGTGVGYLDYIEINTRLTLLLTNGQMSFRDWNSVGAGNVANYQLQGANGNTRVWDVTNPQVPVLMNGTLNGSTYSFSRESQSLHEFAAMDGSNLYAPKYIGTVANQNLHGSPQVDLIIVTAPEFLTQANQLAAQHQSHDHMRTIVATTTEIYNEFSSGSQDISAIRDFARMFYKRATDPSQMAKYLVLFGGASYDYKFRTPDNCNFVPVFESSESLNDLSSFCTDDFYGFLDDNENIEDYTRLNVLDIGVGRLPARSVADATSLVNKVISYTKPATLGPWRINSTFVADNNDDAGNHLDVAEVMADSVASSSKNIYNEDKVYIDALGVVQTPAGGRCPNANAEIDNDVYKGTFLINYNGHGNYQIWAGERILTEDDFNMAAVLERTLLTSTLLIPTLSPISANSRCWATLPLHPISRNTIYLSTAYWMAKQNNLPTQ